ncbi:MAG TPA: alpha/beta hydrolase [Acidimicrobiales bacterium]
MTLPTVTARGIEFSYLERGPDDGPLALLLHGFPDSPTSYEPLMGALSDLGYRVVAPWMRGYAPTSLAPDSSYHVGSLGADANALHEALGGDGRAVLVGHDWGATAAYVALAVAPQRWRRGVAMAVPPLRAMVRAFSSVSQLQRSWYMWLLMTPLGEGAVSANDYALIDELWAQWSPGLDAADASAAIRAAKSALEDPSNLTAALSYYRSMFSAPPIDPDAAAAQALALEVPSVPVLYVHGANDGCIGIDEIGDPLASLAEGSRFVKVERAGHFVHLEQPDEVSQAVAAFLG